MLINCNYFKNKNVQYKIIYYHLSINQDIQINYYNVYYRIDLIYNMVNLIILI